MGVAALQLENVRPRLEQWLAYYGHDCCLPVRWWSRADSHRAKLTDTPQATPNSLQLTFSKYSGNYKIFRKLQILSSWPNFVSTKKKIPTIFFMQFQVEREAELCLCWSLSLSPGPRGAPVLTARNGV